MCRKYREYLESEEWSAKRHERLTLSKYHCEVCGAERKLVVHHLTYARIFRENMDDLMVLCENHHSDIESAISRGIISRHGDVGILRDQTLAYLNQILREKYAKSVRKKLRKNRRKKRNGEHEQKIEIDTFLYKHLTNKKPSIRMHGCFSGLKKISSDNLVSVNGVLIDPNFRYKTK